MTNKQKIFAAEYLANGFNAAAAARAAGYSAKTSNTKGAQLLKIPDVKEYIQTKIEEMESEKIADAKELLMYLTSVVRGEITDDIYVVEGPKASKKQVISPTKERNKAAELMMKNLRMFDNTLDVNVKSPIQIIDDIPDEEDEDEEE